MKATSIKNIYDNLNVNWKYNIKKLDISTYQVININTLYLVFENDDLSLDLLFVCKYCGFSTCFSCKDCVAFFNYTEILVFESLKDKYILPPPYIYPQKMKNFVANMFKHLILINIDLCYIYRELKTNPQFSTVITKNNIRLNKLYSQLMTLLCQKYKNDISDNITNIMSDLVVYAEADIYKKYKSFIAQPTNLGLLSNLFGGKTSHIRNNILGSLVLSIRLVTTIDVQLGPDEVIIPKSLYDRCNFASPLVFVSRHPAINTTCIYVSKIFYEDNISVIKISSFIADGLHADQDGDEINITFIKNRTEILAYNQLVAQSELKNANTINLFHIKPKYQFGQYYKLFFFKNQEILHKEIPILKTIMAPLNEKPEILMKLLCSVYQDKFTPILSKIINLANNYIMQQVPFEKLIDGSGLMDIVNSKSNGSVFHIQETTLLLRGIDPKEYLTREINSYNNYIQSALKLTTSGRNLFTKLFFYSHFYLQNDTLFFLNTPIVSEFSKCAAAYPLLFENVSVTFLQTLPTYIEQNKTKPKETVLPEPKTESSAYYAYTNSAQSVSFLNPNEDKPKVVLQKIDEQSPSTSNETYTKKDKTAELTNTLFSQFKKKKEVSQTEKIKLILLAVKNKDSAFLQNHLKNNPADIALFNELSLKISKKRTKDTK